MSDNGNEWQKNPKIYEINIVTWLNSLSTAYDMPINLLNIPEEAIDLDLNLNIDAIWLMGVWERSPKGREIALRHPGLQHEFKSALRDFKPEDVIGSPYAVRDYQVSKDLGGAEGLAQFREQFAEKNALLILDYVPNHVALDHRWTLERPEMFIQGSKEDLMRYPNSFFETSDYIFAHGKDPYFDPWTDTVQINAFSKEAREQAISTLLQIAELCDGVRCDMAMLLTNKVFSNTWGYRAWDIPEKDFWREVIPAVKEKHPNFLFIAEVYWDMEWDLQQQGFDYCYDKRLYDRLLHDNAQSVQGHLRAEWDYQSKLIRFIENHDEQRCISAFGEEKSKAAAILILTLPGARLLHEGQLYGYKIKVPIQLVRRPEEQNNQELMEYYQDLLNIDDWRRLAEEKWSLCNVEPVGYDISYANLISYCWWKGNYREVVVVNYSPYNSQGHIRVPELNYGNNNWTFIDRLTEKSYTYKGQDLNQYGLYIDLKSWNGHIFDVIKKA